MKTWSVNHGPSFAGFIFNAVDAMHEHVVAKEGVGGVFRN